MDWAQQPTHQRFWLGNPRNQTPIHPNQAVGAQWTDFYANLPRSSVEISIWTCTGWSAWGWQPSFRQQLWNDSYEQEQSKRDNGTTGQRDIFWRHRPAQHPFGLRLISLSRSHVQLFLPDGDTLHLPSHLCGRRLQRVDFHAEV